MKYQKQNPYDSRAFHIECLVHQEGFTEADANRLVIWTELLEAVGKRKCKTSGHSLVCDDFGGPDSGGHGFHCTRCGFGVFNRFY